MNRMDKWLSQRKNFIALVTSIILVAAVISAVAIGANLSKHEERIVEDTEPTEHVAAVVNVVEEPETKKDIPKTKTVKIEPETETVPETQPEKTAEELAWEVINGGYNGPEREAYLGERYKEVQNWIDANYIPPTPVYSEPVHEASYDSGYSYPSGGGVLSPSAGVNYCNGIMETYYNLPMGGVLDIMYALGYSGEYWVRSDGVKMFGPYVMVAADFGWLPRGSVVECSLGTAMVCDTGAGGYGWLDIAVTW